MSRPTAVVSDETRDLLAFIDASPSPYHAATNAAERLESAGFGAVDPTGPWPADSSRGYVVEGGALVAWASADGTPADAPFRLVGAHTDSPNLRVKAQPDVGRSGWRQLGVEVYGGALVNSWLDRDLGLSGRVAVRDLGEPAGFRTALVKVDRPLLRVPQLAIHLDREIGEKGLLLNRQQHLVPVWGLGARRPGELVELLSEQVDVQWHEVLGWDVMLHDLTPSTVGGASDELIFAPRLDNLLSVHAGLTAIERAADDLGRGHVVVLCAFDHEEVGSTTGTGAASSLLPRLLELSVLARGGDRGDYLRALAGSVCASSDMAHATHPNYAERHEPDHLITLNGGPVIKVNANQRYASDARSIAAFQLACDAAGVPTQRYIHRTDLACGSTIGPITAAGLGIPTVDVGVAQLSMHSARELAGSTEPPRFIAALTAFLSGAG